MKIYLVAIVDYDTHDLRHACLSYETALKRFHELRREIIAQNNDMIEFDKSEGIDPSCWIEQNKALETWTPESTRSGAGETPEISEMEVEL